MARQTPGMFQGTGNIAFVGYMGEKCPLVLADDQRERYSKTSMVLLIIGQFGPVNLKTMVGPLFAHQPTQKPLVERDRTSAELVGTWV